MKRCTQSTVESRILVQVGRLKTGAFQKNPSSKKVGHAVDALRCVYRTIYRPERKKHSSMYRLTFYVGMGYTRHGQPFNPEYVQGLRVEVETEAAKRFGGFSSSVVRGGWIDATGKLITEDSLKLEILSGENNREAVSEYAEYLKNMLEQTAILVSVEPINAEFV